MISTESFVKALKRKTDKSKPAKNKADHVLPSTGRGCYGRLVRTLLPKPVLLAEEADRRVVMVMGPGALRSLVGKSPYEMLVQIGHTEKYIAYKLSQGYKFHLAVFNRPAGELRLATWRNTLTLVASVYPQVAPMLKAASRELKATPFAQFEEQAGFSLAEVDRLGLSDDRFINLERLLTSDGSALSVRRFLYHVTRLTELYSGDGYTWTHDGRRGVREYIMANRAINELKGNCLLELEVTLPDGQ
jgi:hypothetical protein